MTDTLTRFGEALVLADHTDEMDRAEWLERRRMGIGGSDAAAICGQDKWRSAFEVWLEKTAAPNLPDIDNEAMQWGRLLEPIVRGEVAEREQCLINPVDALLQHPEREWQLANIDGEAIYETEFGVYEGKTAGHFAGVDWGDDGVPDAYMLQGAHYLAVTGLPFVLFGCLVGGQRLVIRRMQRDEELIAHLNNIEGDFWRRVQDGTPPDPDGSKACTDLLAHLWDVKPGATLTLDREEVGPLIERYHETSAAAKEAKEAKDAAGNQLRLLLGEKEIAQDPTGAVLYTWKESKPNKFDDGAHAEAKPECHEAFKRETSVRTLRVPKPKKGRP